MKTIHIPYQDLLFKAELDIRQNPRSVIDSITPILLFDDYTPNVELPFASGIEQSADVKWTS